MNKVNDIRVGEKIPFDKIYDIDNIDIDYTVFFFPVSNGQLLYGTTRLSEKEIELVRLENPPNKYSQYEYTDYFNHIFQFTNVDNPHDILRYRSFELAKAVPYINTGRITMKHTYAWKIVDQKYEAGNDVITIDQYWGPPIPTRFMVQKLNINCLK